MPPRSAWMRLTLGGSWLLYKLTDALIPLRVTAEQEDIGLDLSQHDETVGESAEPAIAHLRNTEVNTRNTGLA